MKLVVGLLIAFTFVTDQQWFSDFEKAKSEAVTTHKWILLNFSGSDWCGPCITMRKRIFENSSFLHFASSHLVLVNADFPRLLRNRLPEIVEKKNKMLMERFNPEGKFPFTLILSSSGKIIKTFDGLPALSADEFVQEMEVLKSVTL